MSLRKIFIAFIFFFPVLLFAQKAEVRGVIVDATTKEPIVGASVTLVTQTTKAYIRAQQSTANGGFHFEGLDASTYALQVSMIGYDDLLRENIALAAGQNLNLNQIGLAEESEVIEEVVVEARTPDMTIGIDKRVFDVSQSIISVGASASELLDNVPTLEVDQDGSVSLRGSSNVRILIDGKESAMAGSDIASLLQSLPADIIDKVEIMTNPSAKFDAEGQSGIVNIILKKNARIGLHGTVNASAGSFENAMVGATVNYRNSTFNHFLSYNFNRRVNMGEGFNDNIMYNTDTDFRRIYADNDSRRRGHNHTMRFGTDYYLAEKTTLSLASNVSLRDNNRRQDIDYQYFNMGDNGLTGDRYSQQYEDDFGLDLQLDFKQGLKREGEELSGNVSFGYDTEDGTNDFLETFSGSRYNVLRNNLTTEKGNNWNLQLDYLLPLGEDHKFEAGYRSIIRNSEDTQFSEVDREETGVLVPDYNVSNNFELNNAVHALYVNYQRMLTDRLGAQLGLRGEHMDLTSTYYNVDPNNPQENRGGYNFTRLFPSAFLSYEVGDSGDKIQLNYSRRVSRARGWQVNPFINVSDENNLRRGNPNLMPEDIHSMELGFAKFYDRWNFVTTAFYRRTNDMINPIQYNILESDVPDRFKEDYENATLSVWENVGSADDVGVELISQVDVTSWWDATANVNVFNNRISPIERADLQRVNDINWNANLTTNLKLMSTLSLQFRGHYRSPRKRPQGIMKEMWGADVAVKKDVFNNRASVLFNVRDVFNSRRFEMESYLPQRTVHSSNRWNRRMFTLTFSYRFGIQDIFNGRNGDRNGDNMSIGEDMGEGGL